MPEKLFVIGLDCFDPTLAFDWWWDDLPNLRGLAERGPSGSGAIGRGAFGRLESTIPPITVPAWTCMLTGKDPGEQGFYGFRNRADHTYGAANGNMMIARNSNMNPCARIFLIKSSRGFSTIIRQPSLRRRGAWR